MKQKTINLNSKQLVVQLLATNIKTSKAPTTSPIGRNEELLTHPMATMTTINSTKTTFLNKTSTTTKLQIQNHNYMWFTINKNETTTTITTNTNTTKTAKAMSVKSTIPAPLLTVSKLNSFVSFTASNLTWNFPVLA